MPTEKSMTAEVYSCIRDEDYAKAIQLLEVKLGQLPRSRSRPLLSLIAHCCYHNREYARAAEFYESLTDLHPEVEEYKVYYVQSLLKAGSYADASRVAASAEMTTPSHSQRMRLLQANAELEQGQISAASTTLSQCSEDDPETIVALATVDFREGRFSKALETYKIARQVMGGDQPMLTYCIALCHYQLCDYDAALALADEIIDEVADDDDIVSHITRQESHDSYLVPALNLKAAILRATKKDDASATMAHFEENLDNVTIHNDAILNIDEDPSIGMQKLEFLLSNQPFPPETLSNLLTLYAAHGQDDLAAETFEANKLLAKELLPEDMYAYFEALVMSMTCPDDSISMLEAQTSQHIPMLRAGKSTISGAIGAASTRPDTSHRSNASTVRPTTAAERKGHRALAVATKEQELRLARFVPALMLQAKLYWDKKEYSRAEKLLSKSADFCRDNDTWRMNMGHIMFAQQEYDASIEHYEALLLTNQAEDILNVPPMALANLCVAYVMTNQNETAEELIKTVERNEQQNVALGNGERTFHSCIINLAIGTLYCERGNYVFGISRICKSMEPFEKNLSPDTWFYAKRSFLSLALSLSKLMCIIKDDTLEDIICFLDDVASHGSNVITTESETAPTALNPRGPSTVASEARQLKAMFVEICA